ncbi:uncharacterized protein LOC127724217 [Mytilus californianus]|uniref:uncharacterized protein LOC127724217 n=1 Tax=Mytilus californianus TaxID=6549 RepID=UPI0022456E4F|nr:uncharacterized protein LOC127724217 [Mytilus californianus]
MFKHLKQTNKSLLKTARLLTITVELGKSTKLPECIVKNSDLIQPLQWKRISGSQGKGLLQLQPFFEMLSLSLLSYRTEKTSISLKSTPQGCLEKLNEQEYELVFRNFLLNFTREKEEICNEHIGSRSQYAIFYHECCHYDQNGNMQCNPVLKNKWMIALEYCTYIVIIIVVLYCPLLVPSSLYDSDYCPKRFVLCLHDHHSSFEVKKVKNPPKPGFFINEQMNGKSTFLSYTKLNMLIGMKKFKEILKTKNDEDTHQFKFSNIYFDVRADELLSANENPISFSKILYNLFLKCGIRNQEGVATCCKSNMFGKCLESRINFQWYKLFRFLLRIILSLAVCLPWVIRISIFYVYENEIRETRHKAAETKNLLFRIEHSIAYYGTPLHILFILSYAFICLGYISLELTSVILLKNVKSLVREILTKCFHGICCRSSQKSIRWLIEVLLHPFSEKGIFGIFFVFPYWIYTVPTSVAVSAYYLFPAVYIAVNYSSMILNIFCTFSCNLRKLQYTRKRTSYFNLRDFCSVEEKNKMHHSLSVSTIEIGLMFIILCLMLSSLLLIVELVIFLIKVGVYTMVGIILNSSHAMQYISTISLAWLYYRRCFGGICQIYESYNKAVQRIMYGANKQHVDNIAKKQINEQENMAFKVKGSETILYDKIGKQKNKRKINIDNHDRVLKYRTNGVILLLDRFDKQYITKKFFFKVCNIIPDGPGPISKHFGVAMRRLSLIFMFLIFVTLVVLAFGDSYNVSFSNQLLATLAGGVVPWILMKTNIVFAQADKKDANELVDIYFGNDSERNVSLDLTDSGEVSVKSVFKKKFDNKIKEDEKWWTIADFGVTKDKPLVDEEDRDKKGNVEEQLDRNDEYNVRSIHRETTV